MKSVFTLLAVAVCALICVATQPETPARFTRTPSLSPDGASIVFSYQGNIWSAASTGGVATRLTANEAFDLNPKWSPDGKWIAFNSDREGGSQVFLMPSQGGKVRQLTAHTSSTELCDWFPDGKSLLVTSFRQSTNSAIYKLDIETGRMELLVHDRTDLRFASVSPDGKWIAYTRGALVDTIRKGYRGSANWEIYVAPADGTGAGKKVSDSDKNDMWPVWASDSKSVFYASERDGLSNVYRANIDGGRPVRVAQSVPDAARFLTSARNGTLVAFEAFNQICTVPATGGPAKPLDIICRTDDKGTRASVSNFAGSNVQEFSLSPDGKRTALIIRGEVFVANNERGGDAKRITDTPHRELNVEWARDGKSLYFSSNRTGSYEIYSVDLASLETKRLTNTSGKTNGPIYVSPDGKWIAYLQSPGSTIRVMKPDGKDDHVLVQGPGIDTFEWSPDNKWVTFGWFKSYANVDIKVAPFEDGKIGQIQQVSFHPGLNIDPVFTKNGESIVFRSNRNRNRDIETINQVGRFGLYVLPLQKPKQTFDFDEDTEQPPAKPDPKKPVEVKIDFEEIERRARQIFPFEERLGDFTVNPDSQTVVFTATSLGQTDFWQMSLDGSNTTRLTTGGQAGSGLEWSPDGQRLYYLSGGGVQWIGKGGQGRGSVNFIARMEIERRVDYLAVFDEAWQIMNDTFYDPTFRGQDWKSIGDRYRSQVEHISVRQDLNYLITQMLGELNGSHTGFGGGTQSRPNRQTGILGIVPDHSHRATGVKIARVIKRSPATKPDSLLKPGEIILEVNGKPVENGLSFDLAMADLVNRSVTLTVNTIPDKVNARKVKIRPASFNDLQEWLYEEWIDERRAMVDKVSGGKLGYLHVPDMGDQARNRFERELFAYGEEKAGMVLDFRFNNGGDTHDSLLQFLDRRKHYFKFQPRGEAEVVQPDRIFTKPTIVIIDEASLSDAEVFSEGYRALGIGKIVGRPTMGWIIFTSGRGLIDGSFIRTPYIKTMTMSGKDMENWGVPPDIEVFFEPSDFVAGRDPQIERAVQELLKQIGGG